MGWLMCQLRDTRHMAYKPREIEYAHTNTPFWDYTHIIFVHCTFRIYIMESMNIPPNVDVTKAYKVYFRWLNLSYSNQIEEINSKLTVFLSILYTAYYWIRNPQIKSYLRRHLTQSNTILCLEKYNWYQFRWFYYHVFITISCNMRNIFLKCILCIYAAGSTTIIKLFVGVVNTNYWVKVTD